MDGVILAGQEPQSERVFQVFMVSVPRIIASLVVISSIMAFGFILAPADDPWSVAVQSQTAHAQKRSDNDYDLTRMALLNRTVIHLKENYVDPKRIDETAMLVAALEAIQEEIDDVLIDIVRDEDSKPKEAKFMLVQPPSRTASRA